MLASQGGWDHTLPSEWLKQQTCIVSSSERCKPELKASAGRAPGALGKDVLQASVPVSGSFLACDSLALILPGILSACGTVSESPRFVSHSG